jgi:hypothetical protein
MRTTTGRWWMLLLVGMVASGSSLATAQKVKIMEPADTSLTKLFASAALAPLREPDRAEALPVQIAGAGLSSDYRVVERPVALGPKTMQGLRKTFLNEDAFGGMTACMFDPAVAFRFYKGTKSVQVLVCFMCGEVVFENADGRGLTRKMVMSREARTQLLAAARRAFPKNQSLQAVKD